MNSNYTSQMRSRTQNLDMSYILKANGKIDDDYEELEIMDNQKKLYDDFCMVNGIGLTLRRSTSIYKEDLIDLNNFTIKPNKQRIVPTI